MSAEHVRVYESTNGAEKAEVEGGATALLYTVDAKSGELRTATGRTTPKLVLTFTVVVAATGVIAAVAELSFSGG